MRRRWRPDHLYPPGAILSVKKKVLMQFCASYLLFTQNCGELSYQSLYSKIKLHDIEAIPREMLQVKLPCNYKSII